MSSRGTSRCTLIVCHSPTCAVAKSAADSVSAGGCDVFFPELTISLPSWMVISSRASASAPTSVVGCFAIAALSVTFGVRSPSWMSLRTAPKVCRPERGCAPVRLPGRANQGSNGDGPRSHSSKFRFHCKSMDRAQTHPGKRGAQGSGKATAPRPGAQLMEAFFTFWAQFRPTKAGRGLPS